jgi:hypothetical protein
MCKYELTSTVRLYDRTEDLDNYDTKAYEWRSSNELPVATHMVDGYSRHLVERPVLQRAAGILMSYDYEWQRPSIVYPLWFWKPWYTHSRLIYEDG